MSIEQPIPYSVLVVNGLPLLLLHVTDEEVATARQRVSEGDVAAAEVVIVVASFLWATGTDPAAYSWSVGDYMDLLELMGMPPVEWSPLDDDELTRILQQAVKTHGQ